MDLPPIPPRALPPGAWAPAVRAARAVLKPALRFAQIQAASGIVLLFAAVVALAWANSPWAASYAAFWHTPLSVGIGPYRFERDLHFWVNDGLMAIFFFVVGLEIRRELHEGELATLRRAALPALAAVGGMVVPAALYVAMNPGPPGNRGWGVPMATDIAFAVGVLTLLGNRVPPSLRVMLLALAIIDDLGAILVIAIFYSGPMNPLGVTAAGAGILLTLALQRFGVRQVIAYVPPALLTWGGTYASGIHPTIAGVVIGLLTPVRSWLGGEGFLAEAERAIEFVKARASHAGAHELARPLSALDSARREAVPPATWLELTFHPWVAWVIMPVFALANAGVSLAGVSLADPTRAAVVGGVVAGLVFGKPVGILLFSFLGVKLLGLQLPPAIDRKEMSVLGLVAGIGFTMSIFIAGLAFTDPALLAAAKLGVLGASLIAGVLGLVGGYLFLKPDPSQTGDARMGAH